VIFLTRRRPSSLASCAAVYRERVTRSEVSALTLQLRANLFRTGKESR
jgi:hypothetical protein